MTAMHLGSFEAIDLALDPFRQRGLGIGHRVGDVRTYVGLGGHLFGPDHGAAGPNKLYLRSGKKGECRAAKITGVTSPARGCRELY